LAVKLETRQVRAWEMLSNGNEIKRINENAYRVKSQTGNGAYLVVREGLDWSCECPDFVNRQVACKHIYCVFFSRNFREQVTSRNLNLALEITSPDQEQCANCGSTRINKWGWKHRKDGTKVQRFKCMSCSHRWNTKTEGFEHMRANPHTITVALDLYFKGVSLRKIVDHLNQFEQVNVSHVAVLKWIQKYVAVMRDYVDAMKPELSRVFHADETKVNIRGQWVWLWHLMDGDTRFLLANHVSKTRNVSDAREAFRDAKAVAKVEPRVLLTDGLGSYGPASQREFPDAVHVAGVGLQGRLNNNRMERYHGTLKERTKVMRALKNTDTSVLDGQRIYYNHIRPHQGLNGKTPAQAAGLGLDLGPNKWRGLIEKSTKDKKRLGSQIGSDFSRV
jgi:transposase-like protein/DNA-directed RNA polymerase subunit M/transcription elongation factor TFIIS